MIVPSVLALPPVVACGVRALADVQAWRLWAAEASRCLRGGGRLRAVALSSGARLALTRSAELLAREGYDRQFWPWTRGFARSAARGGGGCTGFGRPDRRSQHRAVLGVHHVRGAGNRGADRAHLAGEPQRAGTSYVALTVAVAAVVASWYLVPYLGWGLLHQSKQVDDLSRGAGSPPAAAFLAMTAGSARADRPGWPGVVARPGVVGEAAAAADRQRLRLLADMPGALQRERAHCLLQDTPRVIELLAAAGVLSSCRQAGHRRRLAVGTCRPACRRSPVPAHRVDGGDIVAGLDAGRSASNVGLFEPP